MDNSNTISRSTNILDNLKQELGKTLVIAHRGFAKGMDFERNTLPAFKYALEVGAHGFESDLRITKDGKVVTHHDPWIRRGFQIKRITKHNYSDLVELLDDKSDLPLIQDVYKLLPKDLPFFMQIKDPKSFPEIIRQLKDLPNYSENIIVMGYVKPVLDNELPSEFTYGKHYLLPRSTNLRYIKNKNKSGEEISIASPYYRFLNDKHLDLIHEFGFQSVLYTINDLRAVKYYIDKSVDAIYSDNTKKVLSLYY